MRVILLLFAVIAVISCQKRSSSNDPSTFSSGVATGEMPDVLEEASGLVASIRNPGYLWTHNDSGHPADVYLMDTLCHIVLTCHLDGLKNRDWEDISIGISPGDDKPYLYVADIGDNKAQYDLKFIYRFEEPLKDTLQDISIGQIETLALQLPDGKRDAEAMAFDPMTGDLWLFSKREEQVRTYQILRTKWVSGDTLRPEKIGTIPFNNVVAADFSHTGKGLLLKTYDQVAFWRRAENESVKELLKRQPELLPYESEPQGESVAWSIHDNGYFTVSESHPGQRASLMYYKRAGTMSK